MSAKHTPGPWRLEVVEDRSIRHLCPVDADDLSILTIVHQDETPFAAVYNEDDARLIAAAPELLEALQTIMAIDAHCSLTECEADAIKSRARAAIAKATGDTK